MGEILADTFALGQGFERGGVDFGAGRFVFEFVVNALHERTRCFEQRQIGRKRGHGESGKGLVARDVGRGEQELGCRVVGGLGAVAEVLAHAFPAQRQPFLAVGQWFGCRGFDQGVGLHGQGFVWRLEREKGAQVAKDVDGLAARGGGGIDLQAVTPQFLRARLHRRQVRHVLSHVDGALVVVVGAVEDSQQHGGRGQVALRGEGAAGPCGGPA